MRDLSNVCGVDLSKSKYRDKRTKGWSFILYPDSEYYNEDWLEDLERTCLPYATILHDEDYYTEDKKGHYIGEIKKKHYHVAFWFGSSVRFTQAVEIMEMCGGCRLEPVVNKSGFIQYLTHKNNPEKHQYEVEQVKYGGGLDFNKYYYDIESGLDEVIEKVRDFLKLNDIWTSNQFIDYASKYNKEWFTLYIHKDKLRKFVDNYCKSMGYEVRYFVSEDDKFFRMDMRKNIKYFRIPKYGLDGKVVLDENGDIVADKQIII